MLNKLLIFSILCVIVLAEDEKVIVPRESKQIHIESGDVVGYKNEEAGIYEFRSIPYATAPTGEDKFKPPNPPPVWDQPLDAINMDVICPQVDFIRSQLNKTEYEDCLIASVYVPDTEEKNLSVVVYIHGGAFQLGFGDWLVPRHLVAEHNIIAVTFNYRLGAHGFLCLGTENIPGNAGLKDQVALLKWVKKNIASFGGNPDDVTIAGYSAGASSVGLLMLSKEAEGLFSKVISDSASNIAPGAIQPKPLTVAKWFAKFLKFEDVDDIEALEKFFLTATFEQLTSDSFMTRPDSTFGFTPCVERPLENSSIGGIFYESPIKILEKGDYKKVPLLYGFTNMEGQFRLDFFEVWSQMMNDKFSDFLPGDLKLPSKDDKEKLAKKVKKFYFGKKTIDNSTILSYVDYFTDVIFAYPILRAVKVGVESGNNEIYLYEYSFVDDNTPYILDTKIRGANHCDQTTAIFGSTAAAEKLKKPTEEYRKISITLRELWANFIKTGKPVPEGFPLPSWPPVSSDWAPHMSIAQGLELKDSAPIQKRARFWDDIYSKYYRHPIPPVKKTKVKHTEL